jgi:hypothetical protein
MKFTCDLNLKAFMANGEWLGRPTANPDVWI